MEQTTEKFEAGETTLMLAMYGQAGTEVKAISELTVNGLDSGSPEVHIHISTSRFEVKDTGCGFKSELEIDEWFSKVAFSHDTELHSDENRAGRHGLGRLQCCVYAKAVWRTHTFEMSTDAQNKGFSYVFRDQLPFVEGCTVSGEWYNPLTHAALKQTIQTLSNNFKYASKPIYINGEKINQPLDTMPTLETENFRFWATKSNECEIVNLNEFVQTSYNQLSGGIVISKKGMLLNTSRTAPLDGLCNVWADIKSSLSKYENNRLVALAKNGKKLGRLDLDKIFSAIRTKRINYLVLTEALIIPTVAGGNTSINNIVTSELPLVFRLKKATASLKKKHRNNEAIIINFSELIFSFFDSSTINETVNERNERRCQAFLNAIGISKPFSIDSSDASDESEDKQTAQKECELVVVDINKLTARQNAMLRAIVPAYHAACDSSSHIESPREIVPTRNIMELFRLEAITDGQDNVMIDLSTFARKSSGNGSSLDEFARSLMNLLNLSIIKTDMVEWKENNSHPHAKFIYETSHHKKFFDLVMELSSEFGQIVTDHFQQYLEHLKASNVALSKSEKSHMDLLKSYPEAAAYYTNKNC